MSVFADEFEGGDLGAKISAAIISLPPDGGIVDATRIWPTPATWQEINIPVLVDKPIRLLLGAGKIESLTSPSFKIEANFSIIGLGREFTSLRVKNGGKLFELSGSWPGNGTGSPYFSIERMTLIGHNQSNVFDTTYDAQFNEGSIRIEDNLIKNFRSVALVFKRSVYYGTIRNNYFDNNYGSIYFEYGCDSEVVNNKFLQGQEINAGPQIVIVAPNVRVCGNHFYGSANSAEPDILLRPTDASADGGWVWIIDNKFGAERETFNPARSRIASSTLPDGYPIVPSSPSPIPNNAVSGPTIIHGNHFLGPSHLVLCSATRENGKVWIATKSRHGIPVATKTSVGIFQVIPTSFNGLFTVTAINEMSFTYEQAGIGNETVCRIGIATLSNGEELEICSASRINDKATIITQLPHGIPISSSIPSVSINISITNLSSFNGLFTVTAINEMSFTYDQVGPEEASSCGSGIAILAEGNAILLDNPIDRWDISQNVFWQYGVLVNDKIENLASGNFGLSLFNDNRVISPYGLGYKTFKNGGKQFGSARLPSSSSTPSWDSILQCNDSLKLNNYLKYSEDISNQAIWVPSKKNNDPNVPVVHVKADQLDPFGTIRAVKVMRDGVQGSESIQQTDLFLPPSVVTIFWAKAGTASSVVVGLLDNVLQSFVGEMQTFSLGDDWKQYKFVSNGLIQGQGHSWALLFYQFNIDPTRGDFYLFGPQVSDHDSDYFPTHEDPYTDDKVGRRFEKGVIFTSINTSTHTGDKASKPEVKGTLGLGVNGFASIEDGSSDFAGVIELTTGSNGMLRSGSISLKYNVIYTKISPVVIACLQDDLAQDYGQWSDIGSQVKVTKSVPAGCTILWRNRTPLSPKTKYKISYIVIGRSVSS